MDQLISKAKKGDADSFVELMELNKADMYRTAYSILRNDADSADAIQETILKCWKSIHKLKSDKYFKTWLTRILINSCNDIIRKNSRTVYVESYEGLDSSDSSDVSRKNIDECFSGINENYRIILILYYTKGFSIKEIAQIMKMKENTVKTRLARGRKQFRQLYTESEAVTA
ncbi:MAG: RNA polymerase sigma factor [Porcipelethomonas sp.]